MILDHLLTVLVLFICICANIQSILHINEPSNKAHLSQFNHSTTINKVILTQKGYIQFLKYYTEVKPLSEYTFCIWINSHNLTYSHPLLSYSKHEEERLIRVWITPKGRNINTEILNVPVFSVPVNFVENQWYHVCQSWSSHTAVWNLFVNGHLLSKGNSPELKGRTIKGEGDIVVGQEYTDFDKGLEDGIEGAIYGFNLVLSPASYLLDLENQNVEFGSDSEVMFDRKKREYPKYRLPPAIAYGMPITELRRIVPKSGVRVYQTIGWRKPKIIEQHFILREKPIVTHNGIRGHRVSKYRVPAGEPGRIVTTLFNDDQGIYPKITLRKLKPTEPDFIAQERPKQLEYKVPILETGESGRYRKPVFQETKVLERSPKEQFYQLFENDPVKSANKLFPYKIGRVANNELKKPLGLLLVEFSYDCSLRRGAPLEGPQVLINWAKTPVRVFGGAILKSIPPFC